MRRLAALLALLVVAAPAAAATVQGTPRGELVVGTPQADRISSGAGDDFVQAAFGAIDRVDCGGGRDVATLDLGDAATRCEVAVRRISVDPYANTDSQHETAVEPDSFAWGSTVVTAFQVGRRTDGASADIGTAVSHDGGRTWQRGFLPGLTVESQPAGPETGASDPTVAYDAVHGVWLVGALTIQDRGPSRVYVARSTDGLSWSAPVAVASGPILDKDWFACDNGASSPYRGRCYATYTDDQKSITVSQSSDDGGLTWSAPVRVTTLLVGTQPVVQPDGTLVIVAGDYVGGASLSGSIAAARSTDGGATFTRSTVSDLRSDDTGAMRAIALPSVDVDSAGTLYASWHDCRFRRACAANDIVVSTSTDGQTWTPPTRVPLAPTSSSLSAFIPGLAADPSQPGRLGLVYAYYRPGSCARRACLLEIGFTSSADGGRTWAAPQRLDAQPMRTTWLARAEGGRMVGDYFSTSFAEGRVVPVFALAAPPLRGRLREAIFATSLPVAR